MSMVYFPVDTPYHVQQRRDMWPNVDGQRLRCTTPCKGRGPTLLILLVGSIPKFLFMGNSTLTPPLLEKMYGR